ncbi:putative mitochondrial chaperone BCS1 [Lyophyllum shimeji]|uniref:Mitochondrial chaperone BCS1 n=1 Tax=Lyophyllum shimeji TaxID=47721 RepID=A0A9P3PYH7_LYOSH|nr:putative mitochondrial chaperone BCS1 [Lyophyllum shimeji]
MDAVVRTSSAAQQLNTRWLELKSTTQRTMISASRSTSGGEDGSGLSFNHIMGLSFVAGMASNPYLWDSARLLILGTLIETGRRLCQWLMERFKFQYCITAQFTEGDPSYEWIVLFLTQENVWRRSRDFRVNEKNSKRKWGLKLGPEVDGSADYVPTYKRPQLFRWKGYWMELKRSQDRPERDHQGGIHAPSTMYLSIYTLDMNVLYKFVEETRVRYKKVSRPNVTVHMADMPTYGPGFIWSNVKHKARRPLSSIILNEGVIESLVKDAREFIDTEEWYVDAGIPHRRGYLLYGPPGTGKTSTIYALAGELGLEIYALSLSSGLSAVTLSGLLNVIDGVGSEEGKLFFATTNYIDRLDPALLRPGRIDMRIQYKLATKAQAHALFLRFFARAPSKAIHDSTSATEKQGLAPPSNTPSISDLADQFVAQIPEHEFSTAELQGFLLSCKRDPQKAVTGAAEWITQELGERRAKREREEERKAKAREKREERERRQMEGAVAKFGGIVGGMVSSGVAGGVLTGGLAPSPPGMVTGDAITSPPSPSPAYEENRQGAESGVLPLTIPASELGNVDEAEAQAAPVIST